MCRYDPSSSAREPGLPNGRMESVRTTRCWCCSKYTAAAGSAMSIDERNISIAASRPLVGGNWATAPVPAGSRTTSRRLRILRIPRSTMPRTTSLYRSRISHRMPTIRADRMDAMVTGDGKQPTSHLSRQHDLALCCCLLVAVWIAHATSRTWTSTDSRWTIPTALSIINDHTASLDRYASLIAQDNFYAIDCVTGQTVIRPVKSLAQCTNGHCYNFYPIGVDVLAVPEVFAIQKLVHAVSGSPLARSVKNPYRRRLLEGDLIYTHPLVEVLIASFWIALAAVLLYLITRQFVRSIRSLIIALLFAFGTSAWSTGSRALWQHGASMLLISVASLAWLKADRNPNWWVLAGF